ncbi:MAG: phosphoglucosamine mutase [Actinomycetota bacterium]|nr:phosphoglucosamine mutase [Actinomycetota bacterium]
MARLFGTDGVRGLANAELTPELAMALAVAAAHVLADLGTFEGHRPTAVVGRDGRASGELLEAAVVAGLASAGVDVLLAGVLPTPAVAHLTVALGADLGVVLSASHNPMPDNGVKFFDRGGAKLPDAVEDAIEARMREQWHRPTGAGVGRVRELLDGPVRYVEHLLTSVPASLTGLHVVVDCANGAASTVAPAALRTAGAEVVAIGAEPDGLNINDGCGSTDLAALAEAVRREGADVGIAHDGDADRCLAVDAAGEVVDGDAILAVCAVALHEQARLTGDAVVTTVMTNLGFKRAMAEHGIGVVETPVGDRYVLAAMQREGLVLGGEQSGHVVFLEHATTGDGVLTALQLLGRMATTGRPLRELAAVMSRLPQVLLNIPVADRAAAQADPRLAAAVASAAAELAEHGRVLVRPSGTEALIRVMVEAPSSDLARRHAEQIAATVRTD